MNWRKHKSANRRLRTNKLHPLRVFNYHVVQEGKLPTKLMTLQLSNPTSKGRLVRTVLSVLRSDKLRQNIGVTLQVRLNNEHLQGLEKNE